MTTPLSPVDLDFRPSGYFWPMNVATHLLATIKGAERRKYVQALIDNHALHELEDFIAASSLSEAMRQASGRLHPWYMGGEYLPDLKPNEVEIARITLASTTQDVTSLRAQRGKHRIYYRVVDEYEGETLTAKTRRTSIRPLTLRQLVAFLDGASCMQESFAMNELLGDVRQMKAFMHVSSPFYPDLERYSHQLFETWAAAYRWGQGESLEAPEDDRHV